MLCQENLIIEAPFKQSVPWRMLLDTTHLRHSPQAAPFPATTPKAHNRADIHA